MKSHQRSRVLTQNITSATKDLKENELVKDGQNEDESLERSRI